MAVGRWIVAVLLAALLLGLGREALGQDATGGPAGTPAGTATVDAAVGLQGAVAWLLGQQAADGGFPGFDGTSDPGTTCDAISALAAAATVGLDVAEPIARAYAFLTANALEYALTGTGQSAKLVLAAVAAGGDPRDVGGVVPLELVRQGANAETGVYGTGMFDHALALLALAATGEDVPEAAIAAVAAAQVEDGSWAFDGAITLGGGDTNTTALVVQALAAVDRLDDALVQPALAYLASAQAPTGGFAYAPGDPLLADANSTALAVQTFVALGLDPSAPDLLDAAGALAAFQNPSGAFRYTDEPPDDNLFATLQAIPALAGVALPVDPAIDPPGTPAASR